MSYKGRVRRVGIVDLGSNTARLVVYEYEPGFWYRLVDQIREPIRLGEGVGLDGRLTAAAIERAAAALALFSDYARSTELPALEILGTSALRDARNREAFFDRVAGLDVEIGVLAGADEARLGVLAVANGLELDDAWVIDLGGGSAQLSRMADRRWAEGEAHPLGALRLTERFLGADPPTPEQVGALEAEVEARLAPLARRMREGELPLVALGGSVRNLARAVQRADGYALDRLHGYFLRRSGLESLCERLLALPRSERRTIPGLNADRADILVAAALVFRRLLRAAGRDGLWISGHGVREGALFRRLLPPPHLVADVRAFGVRNLLAHFATAKPHLDQVRRLAARLFEILEPIHGLGPRDAELLDAAAMLQDIGLAVNYYRHDRHGAYVVSSAQLTGFTHREQALLALLVRYHLKGTPGLGRFAGLCGPDDERRLDVLACCLRLADHLDRSRSRRVEQLEAEIADDRVDLLAATAGDAASDLWRLEVHEPLFRRAFGRRLRCRAAPPAAD